MTTAQGPFTSTDFGLEDLVDQWRTDHKLSADAIESLRGEFNELTAGNCLWTPMIAPFWACAAVDLPQGCTWCEVLASLLDACLNFREGVQPLTHLQTIRQTIREYLHLPTAEA